MLQGHVFCWPYCRRASFFAGPTASGPGFLLALLSQGQVSHWPYCLRARFFAGPTVAGPDFLLALVIHPWRADNYFYSYVAGLGFLLALIHPWRADDFFYSYVAGPGLYKIESLNLEMRDLGNGKSHQDMLYTGGFCMMCRLSETHSKVNQVIMAPFTQS